MTKCIQERSEELQKERRYQRYCRKVENLGHGDIIDVPDIYDGELDEFIQRRNHEIKELQHNE